MKLRIISFLLGIILLWWSVFADSPSKISDYSNIVTIDGKKYFAKSTDSGLVFFPVNQAVKVIKSVIWISDDKAVKDSKPPKTTSKILENSVHNSWSGSVSGTVIEVLPKSEYLVIQRAIRNHKKALDVIASVIKKHNSKKSLQTIEKLYKQTAESLQKLEIELKKPTISKTEIKNTISLIQKQIKQMQSELKKLDK